MTGRIMLATKRVRAISLLAAMAIVGCGESDPPVVKVESDDPEMQRATEEARQSIGRFIAALQNPTPSQSYLAGQRQVRWIVLSMGAFSAVLI
jgi:hypothetical protein